MEGWDAVCEFMKNSSVCKKAVICAAAYTLVYSGENRETLKEFFTVVGSGFPIMGCECTPAIVLRNMLLNWSSKNEDRVKYFSANIEAFRDFKNGTPRTKAYTKTNNKALEYLKAISMIERKGA